MAKTRIRTSERYKKLVEPAKFQREIKTIIGETAKFIVGKSQENRISGSIPPSGSEIQRVPLAAGFSKWRGRGNKTTRGFQDYSDNYEDFKDLKGLDNWGIKTGQLFKQVFIKPKITIRSNGLKIAVGAGPATKYAEFVNNLRQFMVLNSTGERQTVTFIQKQLIRAFGKPGVLS